MDLALVMGALARDAEAIRSFVEGTDGDQARWKPAPDRWSILEVVNHLADEEVEDFRARCDLTLHDPDREWAPIDPQGAAAARRYNERDPEESLDRFLSERRRSLEWLAGLADPDWDRRHVHPVFGEMRAGQILISWAAHDLLHLRQLARIRYEQLARVGCPGDLDYAGSW